jgi:hypothetical protein
MRTAMITGLAAVLGYAASAQFSLLPQVGFENSRTNISYNNLSDFSPLGVKFSPQASLRLDYKFKKGHGPFVGISSSRSLVSFSFSDPENGMNIFSATTGDMQLRLEGGYQYSSKPIYFNKNKSQRSSASKSSYYRTSGEKKSCGNEYASRSSSCGKTKTESYSRTESYSSRCGSSNKVKQTIAKKEKGGWMRIQPSLGIGYIPFVKTDVVTKTQGGLTTYQYNAGNWNTALVTGAGFEFGKNNQRLFTVSINYFNAIGNLDKQMLTTVSNSKTSVTYLQSDVSGWNMKVGIPFTLSKRSEAKQQKEQKTRRDCGQYKIEYRCRQRI